MFRKGSLEEICIFTPLQWIVSWTIPRNRKNISACKLKLKLNTCNLCLFKQHRIKNTLGFGKPLSSITINICKLYCAKKRCFMLTMSAAAATFLGLEASRLDRHTVETCIVVRWIIIPCLFFFFFFNVHCVLRTKYWKFKRNQFNMSVSAETNGIPQVWLVMFKVLQWQKGMQNYRKTSKRRLFKKKSKGRKCSLFNALPLGTWVSC